MADPDLTPVDRPGRRDRACADARVRGRGGDPPDARDGRGVVLEPVAPGATGTRARRPGTRSPSWRSATTATGTRCSTACGRTGLPATPVPRAASRRGCGGSSRSAQTERPEGSYVVSLLDAGPPAAARKVGEEGLEAALAGTYESDERLVEELADLWFHSYVLLAARGLDPQAVEAELRRRHIERTLSVRRGTRAGAARRDRVARGSGGARRPEGSTRRAAAIERGDVLRDGGHVGNVVLADDRAIGHEISASRSVTGGSSAAGGVVPRHPATRRTWTRPTSSSARSRSPAPDTVDRRAERGSAAASSLQRRKRSPRPPPAGARTSPAGQIPARSPERSTTRVENGSRAGLPPGDAPITAVAPRARPRPLGGRSSGRADPTRSGEYVGSRSGERLDLWRPILSSAMPAWSRRTMPLMRR